MKIKTAQNPHSDSINLALNFSNMDLLCRSKYFESSILEKLTDRICDELLDSEVLKNWIFSEPIMNKILEQISSRLANQMVIKKG